MGKVMQRRNIAIPGRATTVAVLQLPETWTVRGARMFLFELETCIVTDRPLLVVDCSKAGRLDGPATYLLLQCLEAAMKRNGDVRLAGVSRKGRATLESEGVSRLFRIFDSNAEAIKSFQQGAFHATTGEAPCDDVCFEPMLEKAEASGA